jgi:LuxR family maltose regulon positive regulatory protein
MSTAVLTTKLYMPPPPPEVVFRPRLIERLNEGLRLHHKLTLIAAPAGFGKSTLLSAWVASCDQHAAWLSLDAADSDPARFLTYLIAALQTIAVDIGKGVLSVLDATRPEPPAIDSLLTALLNEISALPDPFILILDDYHVVDAKAVDHALTFLLEHLPPQMHLVITTREDPQLPLARLRSRSQLTELRAADLRFTPTEAAEFLNRVMGLPLAAEEVAALEARTEGWIAGLQLAALALQGTLAVQGQQDVPAFIHAFAGDHRYIVDYLVEEVLQRQPAPVRNFLLQTSILDWLSGPLCDAVTGQEGGAVQLQALQRGNFFVVPLDDQRHWYRYHHLFAEVLHAYLMAEQPDQVATLHRRASKWYEHQGSAADAIRHALAAHDFARAADLIEMAVPEMRRNRQVAAVLGWLKALPAELIHFRPVLSVYYAGALLTEGVLEGVEAHLQDAERWLDVDTNADRGERPDTPAAQRVVVNEKDFRGLAGSIAMYRAASALAVGHVTDTLKYARRVIDLVPDDNHLLRGAAAGLLGLAYWTQGDLGAAHQSYVDCMARLQRAGYISDAIGCVIALADIRIAQGRLHEAMHTYERALQLVREQTAQPGAPTPVLRGTADLYVGMSQLHYERNDLTAARQHLLRSKELGEHMGSRQNPYRWRVAMAQIQAAQGDWGGALDLLREAERLYVSDFFPHVRPVSALKARVWVAQGEIGQALGWVREQGLSAADDLSYLREFEHITLSRVLVAQDMSDPAGHSMDEAMQLLERLLQAAQEGKRAGSMIEILIVQALARQAQDDIPAALVPLERALALGEPEGYVRIFVDEGAPMAVLLAEAAQQGIAVNYVHQLLRALGTAEDKPPVQQVLIEPLSQREIEVLRLLRTDLSGPDMARELRVSLHTLRSHTKNIYTKLGVNNRRAAVRRAAELDLL